MKKIHLIGLLAFILLVQSASCGPRRSPAWFKYTVWLDDPDRDTEHDIVDSSKLPGCCGADVNFTHYSGYLANGKDKTHYWFVESQGDPLKAPVLVWLNGGPGVSSLNNLFYENGPFELQPDGKSIKLREFTWNKFANILYMDNPMEVGFSYRTGDYYGIEKPSTRSDESTDLLNYHALKRFFQKFPEFSKNPLYLMGQGYGGVYALGLANKIDEFKSFPNLAGVAIGNGFLHANLLAKASVFHAREHGLISDNLWKHVSQFCCIDVEPTRAACIMRGELVRPECLALVNSLLLNLDRNPYNIQQKCSQEFSLANVVFEGGLAPPFSLPPNSTNAAQSCPVRFKIDNNAYLANYLESARGVLNIPDYRSDLRWENQNELRGYTQTHAFREQGLASQVRQVLVNKIPILLYNGDLDMVCSGLGNEWFIQESVGLKASERSKPWKLDNRIVGYKKLYEGLTFVTVEGAGHSAPMDKPREMFELIKSFVAETTISEQTTTTTTTTTQKPKTTTTSKPKATRDELDNLYFWHRSV